MRRERKRRKKISGKTLLGIVLVVLILGGAQKIERMLSGEKEPEENVVEEQQPQKTEVEKYAESRKIPVELAQSFHDALSETQYADKFSKLWFDKIDEWAFGDRYDAWCGSGDSKVSLLVYVSRDNVESIYDRSGGGREEIYQTQAATQDSEQRETETLEDGSIRIIDGSLGEYGKEVTIPSQTYGEYTYTWYMIPAGTYTATNEFKFATIFIVADADSGDVRDTVQFMDTGDTATITVEEGTHIELSVQAEILLTPVSHK